MKTTDKALEQYANYWTDRARQAEEQRDSLLAALRQVYRLSAAGLNKGLVTYRRTGPRHTTRRARQDQPEVA